MVYNDIIIEKVVPGGDGLCHIDGKVVFVPCVLSEERVDLKIIQSKKKYAKAELIRILETSKQRTEPFCPHYGLCGGCNFQHIEYSNQLFLKSMFVRDHFKKMAHIDLPQDFECKGSPDKGYRSRIQLHKEGDTLGFKRRASKDIFPLDHCPILVENLNAFLEKSQARSSIKRERTTLFASSNQETPYIEGDNREIEIELMGQKVYFDASVFFQSNLRILPDLIQYALEDVGGENFMDLYCGVGLFSIFAREKFKMIWGVELNPNSEPFYHKNMAGYQYNFSSSSLEQWIKKGVKREQRMDCILVDPPRVGLSEDVILFLKKEKAKQLIYVSCDPATQARDIKKLLDFGYKIEKLRAFDFYPHTHHIETVALLQLN